MDGRPDKWDRVEIDGSDRSLVETSAPPESGASSERLWIENDRMEVVSKRG